MDVDDVTKILAGLGLGTGAGAVLTAIINTRSARGKSRAEAADLLVGAAERVGLMNNQLHEEIAELRCKQDAIHLVMVDFIAGAITREQLLDKMKEFRE